MSEPTSIAQLPTGWTRTTIEEIFAPLDDGRTLHQGWSPQCERAPSLSDKEWGVLKTTSIQAGRFLPEHNKLLPKTLTPRRQIEVKSGDLLITCAGPRVRCGVACLVRNTRPRLMMSGKMYRFRLPEKQIESRFVEAYLQTVIARDAIDRMKTGGSDSGLNLTHDRFRTLPIPIAPLNEQQRVVDKIEELFTKLDAGVRELKHAQTQLKRYRQSVIKSAVTGELTKEWRQAHQNELEPASILLARVLKERREKWGADQLKKMKAAGKAPNSDEWKKKYVEPTVIEIKNSSSLPAGWTIASIDQVAECLDHRRIPINKKERSNRVGNIPYYGANGQAGWIDDFLFDEPLVLIVEDETFTGREKPFCYKIEGKSWVNNHAHVLRATGAVDVDYLDYSLAYYPFTPLTTGTTGRKKLTRQVLMGAPYRLPPLSEQQQIVSEVERALSIADAMEKIMGQSLKQAERMRQSILKQAFEGKLVPQNPNDEPAELLLECIKIERAKREAEKNAASKPNRGGFRKKKSKRTQGAAA